MVDSVECGPRVWEVGSSAPGRVKLMTYIIGTFQGPSLALSIGMDWIRQGLVGSLSG